jgi:hypothetical protein
MRSLRIVSLIGYRQSIDEAVRFATSPPPFRCLRIVKRTMAIDRDESVIEAIQSIDAIERRSQDLNRRNLLRSIKREYVYG